MKYAERRQALGGCLPRRMVCTKPLPVPADKVFAEFLTGTREDQAVSTTMAFAKLLRNLIRDPGIGKRVVPIIPDEARTFGMEVLFREIGIYASGGQKYEPSDSKVVLSYTEKPDGQLLEEGITEAGSMASFTASGTSYAVHGVTTIPFYIYYSMFGYQRTGDFMWAFGDARGRGFPARRHRRAHHTQRRVDCSTRTARHPRCPRSRTCWPATPRSPSRWR